MADKNSGLAGLLSATPAEPPADDRLAAAQALIDAISDQDAQGVLDALALLDDDLEAK